MRTTCLSVCRSLSLCVGDFCVISIGCGYALVNRRRSETGSGNVVNSVGYIYLVRYSLFVDVGKHLRFKQSLIDVLLLKLLGSITRECDYYERTFD